MDRFVTAICERLTIDGRNLTIVRNPDGFLLREDVKAHIYENCQLNIVSINSSIELRVRFEISDKDSPAKVCYVVDNSFELLPDLSGFIYSLPAFSLSDLFPSYNEITMRQSEITFDQAAYLFNKPYTYNLSAEETRNVLNEARAFYGEDPKETSKRLSSINLDWDKADTIESISEILVKAIKQNRYSDIEFTVDEINRNFQQYIDSKYFTLSTASHIIKPKMVHKILPHIAFKHSRAEKVAVIVVDGMSFWQYMILHRELKNNNIQPKCDFTLAWLPSITKLSRQAIFRGNVPQEDYVQQPTHESLLWKRFWTECSDIEKRFNDYEVAYTYGSLKTEDSLKPRQAFVDVDLDHKMHSSSNNKDLYDLTCNWARNAAIDIAQLHNQGFTIYITTDHGNIHAHKWRTLSDHEKVFLYQNESRGSRYLNYKDHNALADFLANNSNIANEQLTHGNWTVWRTSKCFKNKDEITHGGSHFLEVVIPFITIER